MKTMSEANEVRRLFYIEDLSKRAIARKLNMNRRTVARILASGGPPEYERRSEPRRPVLGPFTGVIDEIIKLDQNRRRKQRHTAKRIFDRLREEYNYPGGYTQVREYVAQARALRRDTFVPLEFGPGEAQVDWGEAVVFDATGEKPGTIINYKNAESLPQRKVNLFVMTLPFSGARFVAVFPRQTQEFFFEGHRMAFEYFGAVPSRIVYDNLKSAVLKVKKGKDRELNKVFREFSEHYLFEPAFCNVAKGNEKGHVENGVKWAQQNLFVPSPIVYNWDELNIKLADRCRREDSHTIRGKEKTVGELLEESLAHFLPLPGKLINSDPVKPQTSNSLCLVNFDKNAYSVPCQYAHHPIIVRASVGKVNIYRDDKLIAEHTRCHGEKQTIYEPWHYLALIERKPRALDYAAPLKKLNLAPCFDVLRRRLEAGQIHSRGTREYIRVLRLLENHSLDKLTHAVGRAIELGVDQYEAIKSLLLLPPEKNPNFLDLSGRTVLGAYRIIPTPIVNYSALINN